MGKINNYLKGSLTGKSLWKLKLYNHITELYVLLNTITNSDKTIIKKILKPLNENLMKKIWFKTNKERVQENKKEIDNLIEEIKKKEIEHYE